MRSLVAGKVRASTEMAPMTGFTTGGTGPTTTGTGPKGLIASSALAALARRVSSWWSPRLYRCCDLTVALVPRTMGIMRGHRAKRGAPAIVMLCLVPALATLLDAFVLGGGNADKDCRVAF